jgi:hypothetical protein
MSEAKKNSAQHHHPHTLHHSTYTTQRDKKGHGKKPHPSTLYLFSTLTLQKNTTAIQKNSALSTHLTHKKTH